MTVWQAFVLGVIQGITEFLPVSSSGHLVLFHQIFGLTHDTLLFSVILHMATLLAIIFYFGTSLLKVTRREWTYIAIGTVPAVLVGLLFSDWIEASFTNNNWVGLQLMATGVITLFAAKKLKLIEIRSVPLEDQLNSKKSFMIGIAQAIAIIPGISRSGSTVAGSALAGLDREAAFRFSFLLAIPALIGAGLFETLGVIESGLPQLTVVPVIVGFSASLIVGILSLSLFRYVILKSKLEWFGWYAILIGIVALLFLGPF